MTPAAGPAGHCGPPGAGQARLVAERRWRLGVHSRGHPHRIIEDLLCSLAAHAVAYKKQAPYNYKCRKVFPALGARAAPASAGSRSCTAVCPAGSGASSVGMQQVVLQRCCLWSHRC